MKEGNNDIFNTILGYYNPGRSFVLTESHSSSSIKSTSIHELAHQEITSASSLGSLACSAGLILAKSKNDKFKERANQYLKKFVNRTRWIQEGTATSCELSYMEMTRNTDAPYGQYSENRIKTLPKSYYLASVELSRFTTSICNEISWRNEQEKGFAWLIILKATAIASFSPSIDSEMLEYLFLGDLSIITDRLDEIWDRYQRILQISIKDLSIEIQKQKNSKTSYSGAALILFLTQRYSEIICKHSDISYSKPISGKVLIEKLKLHEPYLASMIKSFPIEETLNLSNEEINNFANHFREEVIKPNLSYKRQIITIDNILKRVSNVNNYYVLEVASQNVDNIDKTNFIVHFFSKERIHIVTLLVDSNFSDKETLHLLLEKFKPLKSENFEGIVVGYETKQRNISSLLENIKTVDLLLTTSYYIIKNVISIGQKDGYLLQKIVMENGDICWRVVTDLHNNYLKLSNLDFCYTWVLINSITATLRYDNLTE